MIRFSCALGKVFDLLVLDADLLAQKIVFAFEARHVFDGDARWCVASSRTLSILLFRVLLACRDLSRRVGHRRSVSGENDVQLRYPHCVLEPIWNLEPWPNFLSACFYWSERGDLNSPGPPDWGGSLPGSLSLADLPWQAQRVE